jgi:hypothetical protein
VHSRDQIERQVFNFVSKTLLPQIITSHSKVELDRKPSELRVDTKVSSQSSCDLSDSDPNNARIKLETKIVAVSQSDRNVGKGVLTQTGSGTVAENLTAAVMYSFDGYFLNLPPDRSAESNSNFKLPSTELVNLNHKKLL